MAAARTLLLCTVSCARCAQHGMYRVDTLDHLAATGARWWVFRRKRFRRLLLGDRTERLDVTFEAEGGSIVVDYAPGQWRTRRRR